MNLAKNQLARVIGATLATAYFLHYLTTYRDWHFIDTVNLIFHEAGHTIFTNLLFGNFIHILMGSGFQVLLPTLITIYFFYTGQKLSSAIALMWVGQNWLNVSVYAGDSIVEQLPLLGGDESGHDWHNILTMLHILSWTPYVAETFYTIGVILIFIGVVFAYYFAISESPNGNS